MEFDYGISVEEAKRAYIEHHGVKGQKWGVRNEKQPSGRIGLFKRALYNNQAARSYGETASSLRKLRRKSKRLEKKGLSNSAVTNAIDKMYDDSLSRYTIAFFTKRLIKTKDDYWKESEHYYKTKEAIKRINAKMKAEKRFDKGKGSIPPKRLNQYRSENAFIKEVMA